MSVLYSVVVFWDGLYLLHREASVVQGGSSTYLCM